MKTDYIVREYREGDEVQINALFNDVFTEKRTLEEWKWKFMANPVSDLNLVTVAEAEGRIVGNYASIPMALHYNGGRILVGQPVDTFVHTDYRGTKILLDMFKRHEEIYIKRGYIGGFGFPNRQAYVVGKRVLKYSDLLRLTTLHCRLNLRQSIKFRFKGLPPSIEKVIQKTSAKYYSMSFASGVKGLDIIEDYRFDERVERLWERVRCKFPILNMRDLKYLKWRYQSYKSQEYHSIAIGNLDEIHGYLVYKLTEGAESRDGVIVDCLWDDDNVLKSLILAVLQKLSEVAADSALWRLNKGTVLNDCVLQCGFQESEDAEDIPVVYYIVAKHAELEKAVKDPSRWYFTHGDSDGI